MDHSRQEALVLSNFDTLPPDVFCDAGLECFIYVAPQIEGPSDIVAFTNKGAMPLINPPSVGSAVWVGDVWRI